MTTHQQAESLAGRVAFPLRTSLLNKPIALRHYPNGMARIFQRLANRAVSESVQPDEACQIVEESLWTITWSNVSQQAHFTVKQNSRSANPYFPIFLKRSQLLHNGELSCVLVASSARESARQFNGLPRAANAASVLDYEPVQPFAFGLGMPAWPLSDRPSCWLISVWRSKFWIAIFDRSSSVIFMVVERKGSHHPRKFKLAEADDRNVLKDVLELIAAGHHHPTDQTYKELGERLGLVLGGVVVVPRMGGHYYGTGVCPGQRAGPVE